MMNSTSSTRILQPWATMRKGLEAERQRRKRENRLALYTPYPKQAEFHAAGATYRERSFMAGNQLGKTLSGSAEAAIHLTGRYPEWWRGRVFDRPIRALAGSESSELTRDGVQRLLVGDPRDQDAWGTGFIPKNALVDWSRKSGVPDAVDGVVVAHGGGGDVQAGRSTLNFKSYDQGRSKWQADTLNFVWFDEEPSLDIYSEGLTRVSATQGLVYGTFTPLLGMSEVVRRFLMEPNADRININMTIDDALHLYPRTTRQGYRRISRARARRPRQGNSDARFRPHFPGRRGGHQRHNPGVPR
jgi:phage terminase large subunit-like protein